MAALNEITAEIDHILFTCNCFVRFRKRTQRACSWRKAVSKISANFSNCDGIYSQKRIISTPGECALKNNFATFVFLYCDLISLISPWKYLFFFFYLCFLSQPFTNKRTAGEEGGHVFNSHFLNSLHRHLSISWVITAESSPLHRGSNLDWT